MKQIDFKRINQVEIEQKLMKHFAFHIGEDDASPLEEIFLKVTGVNPYQVDSFKRFYWYEIIIKIIRKLRREDKAFIIRKNGKFFVLKEQKEADGYRKQCDIAIERMEKAENRADEWVEKEKWKKLLELRKEVK